MMTEGVKILTIDDLTERIKSEWRKKEKEAQEEEKRLKAQLEGAVLEEKAITSKLNEARKVVQEMEKGYSEIEAKAEIEKRKQIEAAAIKEEDVKAGRASFKDFIREGKTQKQINGETIAQITEELSQGLGAIRAKRLEILGIEKTLIEIQLKIRSLILQPGQLLHRVLEEMTKFSEQEMSIFFAEVYSSRTALEQINHRLNLTQGKAITPGYRWDKMSPQQAKAVQFDPILPQSLIPDLLRQLKDYEDKDSVVIVFTLGKAGRPGHVDVSSFGSFRISESESWKAL